MELRHLRYFVAVAETGSLSRAAEKLFVAQPPLSLQMRQLEHELGSALFVRHPKGVRLTPAGLALLPQARQLLDQAARLGELVREGAVGTTLTLGFVPSTSSTVLPELVRELRARHAGLTLELREMISSEQAEALLAGRIDAGIARSPSRHPRLIVAQQIPDPFCLALHSTELHAPSDASAAQAETSAPPGVLSLEDYAQRHFVSFTRHRGPAYFDQSIQLCRQCGFSPVIRYEASTVHGVLDLVGAGLGVALVPASTTLLDKPGVRLHRLAGTPGNDTLALLHRRSDPHALLPLLDDCVAHIFAGLTHAVAARLGSG
ncbi:MAG: hypothetical protein RIQ60_296 [Pseudomonadota bacterium]|jgi:DNA-binding transcriptional LysR family regulator